MERQRGSSGSGSPEEPTKRPKACLGALYFSESRYAKQKPPVRPACSSSSVPLPQLRAGRPAAWVCRLPPPRRRHLTRRSSTLLQVCTGFAKRLKPTDDAAQLPTDSVPGGDFKCAQLQGWCELSAGHWRLVAAS